jgi:hypothetical protein
MSAEGATTIVWHGHDKCVTRKLPACPAAVHAQRKPLTQAVWLSRLHTPLHQVFTTILQPDPSVSGVCLLLAPGPRAPRAGVTSGFPGGCAQGNILRRRGTTSSQKEVRNASCCCTG